MKIFIDTADLDEFKELASWGIVDGVTTNPTLVAKSGRSFNEIINEIFDIVDGPISLEVVSEKADDMVKEAKGLVKKVSEKYRKNITIRSSRPEGLVLLSNIFSFTGVFQRNTVSQSAPSGSLALRWKRKIEY